LGHFPRERPSCQTRPQGDGEGIFVNSEKKRGYESCGDDFIPYMTTFLSIGKGIGKLLKLLAPSIGIRTGEKKQRENAA
jgi:hypothetical protein